YAVVGLRVRHGGRTFDEIVETDLALLRIAETHDGRSVSRRNESGGLGALGAPAPVVARLFAARSLSLAHRVELFLRRPAVIGPAPRDQPLGGLLVAREAFHLEKRPFVPVQTQPAHRVEDRLHRGFGRALEVGVLDAQDELAAVLSRVRPGEESGPRPADMEVAGRARSKTGPDNRRAWSGRIVGA